MSRAASREVESTTPLIITIDGPAGTGKTSVARALADRLGLLVLDTGAMYRAAALRALRDEIDPADGPAIAASIAKDGIVVDFGFTPPEVRLDGEPVGAAIRTSEVEEIVSIVAAQPAVRIALVAAQRAIAQAHPRLLTEGRDQGSVVFPDAAVRFYLTASVERRAERRCRQVEESGGEVSFEEVKRAIAERDRLDETRPDGPLVKPEGAIVVDTSDLAFEAVIDQLEADVRASIGVAS